MSTSGNPSSSRRPVPSDGPERPPAGGPPAGGGVGRKTLLLAVAGLVLLLLAGGGLYAMRSHSAAASDADEKADAEPPDESHAAKKSKHAKPAAKHDKAAKEGKSKHGAKEDKKKEDKKEGKAAHAKKPDEAKQAAKEPKSGKAHAKPGSDKVAEAGKHSKEAKKEGKHAKPGKDAQQTDAGGREKPEEGGSTPEMEAADQPAYLGEGRAHWGTFSVKIFDPLTRTMLRTDFGLEAVIACEDEAEFQRFLRSSLQFFREQIMVAMRTSDAVDFADASLALVKRRMVARVNRALGRPFLKSVELKDFTVYESIDNSPYVRWQPAAAEKP